MSLPLILKLIPGRSTRRLQLIHRGYVEILAVFGAERPYRHMCAWGWLEKHEPVHWLDAYDGYRPTKAGLVYLRYEEDRHLILVRPSKVEEVMQRYTTAIEVDFAATAASFDAELRSAVARGFKYDPAEKEPPGKEAAIARLVRRGFVPLYQFQEKYQVTHEELIVCGVLRYLEHRDPDSIPNIDVGHKAKHCLMISTRWQETFVRPGMEEALLALVNIHQA